MGGIQWAANGRVMLDGHLIRHTKEGGSPNLVGVAVGARPHLQGVAVVRLSIGEIEAEAAILV